MLSLLLITCAPSVDARPVFVAPVVTSLPEAPDVPEVVPGPTIEVQPGETLLDIALWSGTTVEVLAELNGIGVTSTVHAGQFLEILPDTEFEGRREEALDTRLERYFEAHGGLVGLSSRVVRTGDTAWQIATDEGVPLWVLAAYNRPLHISRIAIGDELFVPIVGDQVEPEGSDTGPE